MTQEYTPPKMSSTQLFQEADYIRAQNMIKTMLDNDLISLSEFNKITELNRASFSPKLASIMPKIVDNTGL